MSRDDPAQGQAPRPRSSGAVYYVLGKLYPYLRQPYFTGRGHWAALRLYDMYSMRANVAKIATQMYVPLRPARSRAMICVVQVGALSDSVCRALRQLQQRLHLRDHHQRVDEWRASPARLCCSRGVIYSWSGLRSHRRCTIAQRVPSQRHLRTA